MNKVRIVFVLSLIMIVGIISYTISTTGVVIVNPAPTKTATITNEVEPYETDYVYDSSMPSNAEPIVLEEGVNGLDYTYDGLEYVHLSDMKNQVLKVGTGKQGNYTGRLTGYGPDCPGCSKVGNVACKTREGKKHSLTYDGIYYTDKEYGSVRIVAADRSAFSCGTVLKITNPRAGVFYAIVLDTGYTMRKAWSEGIVWMDLAFESQAAAAKAGVTSSNTKFEVQRWGW